MAATEFRQQMTLHLNGGSKFSAFRYRILANGKETGIVRHKKTNGSPKYLITEDFFICGDERFDVMATKGVGLQAWLEAHATTEHEHGGQ
jgi:hypothetical protein